MINILVINNSVGKLMKKIILASVILAASQNIMAWGLSDVTEASNKVNESSQKVDKGIKTAEEAKATKERVEKKGLTESAKTVAKESGKGAKKGWGSL